MIDWIDLGTCIFTAGATIVATAALIISICTQRKMKVHQRKEATIINFQVLQEQVLDKMVSIPEEAIEPLIDGMDDPEFEKTYAEYCALIARCEHFAVGVEEKVYDFKTVEKLAGKHLIHLYQKFLPIIKETQECYGKEDYFKYFEKLINRLKKEHKM